MTATQTLLLPCAGESSRYPGVRPKWMLTTPDGDLSLAKAMKSVKKQEHIRKIVAIRRDHVEAFDADGVLRRAFGDQIEILIFDEDTQGPADTAYQMIARSNITGPFSIKDADAYFDPITPTPNSFVAISDLRENLDTSRVGAKSFVSLNEQGNVEAITEKDVTSNYISTGYYGFSSADKYASLYQKLEKLTHDEIFVSHVISLALTEGALFQPIIVKKFIDVGTLIDWSSFVSKRSTYFVDIDGLLVKNQSKYFAPFWADEARPLEKNVKTLLTKQEEGAQLVFATARPEELREKTVAVLESLGFQPHALIMGCLHGRRFLVNDYAPSNPYPSAVAINVSRDTDSLEGMI